MAWSTLGASASRWKQDVFLSFRGQDTSNGFVSYLQKELQKRGIKTFKYGPNLQEGDAISVTLVRAVEESRLAIVVLSPNYADSTWCLEELTKIVQYMEAEYRILPVFYHVDPSESSFQQVFTKHEISGQHIEKVQQWRDALRKVANLSGWNSRSYE